MCYVRVTSVSISCEIDAIAGTSSCEIDAIAGTSNGTSELSVDLR